MDWDPLTALLPDQPPVAAQEVALLDDQASVALLPLLIVLGVADRDTLGAGGVTDTVVDCEALPPLPVHVRV